jgi:di/tricarboxylate transporter
LWFQLELSGLGAQQQQSNGESNEDFPGWAIAVVVCGAVLMVLAVLVMTKLFTSNLSRLFYSSLDETKETLKDLNLSNLLKWGIFPPREAIHPPVIVMIVPAW